MISSAEATLLIEGYKSQSKVLRIFFIARDRSVNVRVTGSVKEFVEGERLTLVAPNADHCLVVLFGCTFEYGDPREAPDAIRDSVAAKFDGVLTILFPLGERLYLFEMR